MKLFNRVTIIGVGLIGGSIGLGIKERKLAGEVTGVFRRESTLKKALKRKAVDRGVMIVKDGVRKADLIILATPVHLIPELASDTIKYAKYGAIITDVGSTKSWIVGRIADMLKRRGDVSFVGSHPMAGSEHAGVEFANGDLLEGSPCIVTKTAGTNRAALKKVAFFWKAMGAKVSLMSPGEHDRSVSFISHLPHIVAFSLAGAVGEKELKYAAEGYKDTTRIASSDPELWADIFLTNRFEIKDACRLFEDYYRRIRTTVDKNDRKGLVALLKQAKAKRDRFVDKQK